MARRNRCIPKDAFVHVYNRVAGSPNYFPFEKDEVKDRLLARIKELLKFYTIEPISVVLMSNHFHMIIHAPDKLPNDHVIAARYKKKTRKKIIPGSRLCRKIGRKMINVSDFMHDLEQPVAVYVNKTTKRRGHLFEGRFKDVILDGPYSAFHAMAYIELNPVRAGMTADPEDYAYSSCGLWKRTGVHPWADNVSKYLKRIMPWLGLRASAPTMDDLAKALRCQYDLAIEELKIARKRIKDIKEFMEKSREVDDQRLPIEVEQLFSHASLAFRIAAMTKLRVLGPLTSISRFFTRHFDYGATATSFIDLKCPNGDKSTYPSSVRLVSLKANNRTADPPSRAPP
jgi:REP element-mobilizing transposase RayT